MMYVVEAPDTVLESSGEVGSCFSPDVSMLCNHRFDFCRHVLPGTDALLPTRVTSEMFCFCVQKMRHCCT